jgi:hypothetical protein
MRYTLEFDLRFCNYAISHCKDIFYFLDVRLKSEKSYEMFATFLGELEENQIQLGFERILWELVTKNWDQYLKIWKYLEKNEDMLKAVQFDDQELFNSLNVTSIPYLPKATSFDALVNADKVDHIKFDNLSVLPTKSGMAYARVHEMDLERFYETAKLRDEFMNHNHGVHTLILNGMHKAIR